MSGGYYKDGAFELDLSQESFAPEDVTSPVVAEVAAPEIIETPVAEATPTDEVID